MSIYLIELWIKFKVSHCRDNKDAREAGVLQMKNAHLIQVAKQASILRFSLQITSINVISTELSY